MSYHFVFNPKYRKSVLRGEWDSGCGI